MRGLPDTETGIPEVIDLTHPGGNPFGVQRVGVVNRILAQFAMTVSDWQGASFMLSTATGKTEMVDNLSHLWSVAERLSGRACDPLDPTLIGRLEGRA